MDQSSKRTDRVTIVPNRAQAPPNRRFTHRRTTVRPITFIKNWETTISPIPGLLNQQGNGQSAAVFISPPHDGHLPLSEYIANSPVPVIIASPMPQLFPQDQDGDGEEYSEEEMEEEEGQQRLGSTHDRIYQSPQMELVGDDAEDSPERNPGTESSSHGEMESGVDTESEQQEVYVEETQTQRNRSIASLSMKAGPSRNRSVWRSHTSENGGRGITEVADSQQTAGHRSVAGPPHSGSSEEQEEDAEQWEDGHGHDDDEEAGQRSLRDRILASNPPAEPRVERGNLSPRVSLVVAAGGSPGSGSLADSESVASTSRRSSRKTIKAAGPPLFAVSGLGQSRSQSNVPVNRSSRNALDVNRSQHATSMTSFSMATPAAVPVTRPRKRALPPPPADTTRPVQCLVPDTAPEPEQVRLWQGEEEGRKRQNDVLDLDLVLNCLEEAAYDARVAAESHLRKKTITRFARRMQADLHTVISQVFSTKKLKMSLARVTSSTNRNRKELLSQQQAYTRLLKEVSELQQQKVRLQ